MMDRQIDSPIPTPLDFVVSNIKNAVDMLRINARPRIAHREVICPALRGAHNHAPLGGRAQCFGRVEDQVQKDLLQLNAISLQQSQPSLRQAGLDGDRF